MTLTIFVWQVGICCGKLSFVTMEPVFLAIYTLFFLVDGESSALPVRMGADAPIGDLKEVFNGKKQDDF